MAGLTQVLKELMRKRRAIMDRFRQQRDASPQRKAQAEAQAREELAKTDEQIAKVKSELDAATPESLEWGPDAQLDELMERYRSGQPYEGRSVDDIRPYEADSPNLMERRARQRHPDEGMYQNRRGQKLTEDDLREMYHDDQQALMAGRDPDYGKQGFDEWKQEYLQGEALHRQRRIQQEHAKALRGDFDDAYGDDIPY